MHGLHLLDCRGAQILLTDSPVRLAHPMEMTSVETSLWKAFLTEKSIKQPFLQIEEPVADPGLLHENRYDGCLFHSYFLKRRQEDGIFFQDAYTFKTQDTSASSSPLHSYTMMLCLRNCIHKDEGFQTGTGKLYGRYEDSEIRGYVDQYHIWCARNRALPEGKEIYRQTEVYEIDSGITRELLGEQADDYPELFNPELFDPKQFQSGIFTPEREFRDQKNRLINIHTFQFEHYTRQVNHIVAYLDRLTLAGRICKDDPDIRRQLPGLSKETLRELMKLARSHEAYRAMSVLMDYRNEVIGTTDPGEMFNV